MSPKLRQAMHQCSTRCWRQALRRSHRSGASGPLTSRGFAWCTCGGCASAREQSRIDLLRQAVDKLRTVLGQTIEMRPDPSGRPCAHLGAERAEALAFAAEVMARTAVPTPKG